MTSTFRKTLYASALGAVLAAGSMAAHAVGTGELFVVDEGVVPGTPANTVNADSTDFSYEALINQTILGDIITPFAPDAVGDPFVEHGFFTLSSYNLGAISQQAFLNSPAPDGYSIYGTFTGTGEAFLFEHPLGPGILAIFDSFDVEIWLDPNQDTTLALPGVFGPVTPGGATGDDILLGTASLIILDELPVANILPGLAQGDFRAELAVTLTAFGETYFANPTPFYMHMSFGGETTTVTGASLTESFIATVDGSGNAFFFEEPVPPEVSEPSSVALLGLALLALGWYTRRRQRWYS
jgi:hypothetical protein